MESSAPHTKFSQARIHEDHSSYIEGSGMAEAVISTGAIQLVETNQNALDSIIHKHAGLVYRIAYSVLRNHHDAEDATQETFMCVFRYRRQLKEVHDEKAWLSRIAWRVAVGRRKMRHEISLDDAEAGSAISQLRSQLASAEEFSLGREMAGLLQSLISALPVQLRDVLTLSTVQELTSEEIAGILEISESSVRSRMFRARQILKEKLAALEGMYGTSQ